MLRSGISVNSSLQWIIALVFGYIFLKYSGIVDLDYNIAKALKCICKKLNRVINMWLTVLFGISNLIARSSTGNAHLNLTKVKSDSSSEFLKFLIALLLVKYHNPLFDEAQHLIGWSALQCTRMMLFWCLFSWTHSTQQQVFLLFVQET